MPEAAPIHRSPLQLTGRPAKQARDKSADQRRGTAHSRGYDRRWNEAARAYRAAHPLCLGCLAVGRTTAAALVDHIVPHKGDPTLFWDATNLQPLCKWHHDVVKQRLEDMHARGLIDDRALRLDSIDARSVTLRLKP